MLNTCSAHPKGSAVSNVRPSSIFPALSFRKHHCAAKRTIKMKRKSVAASPDLLGSVGRKYEPNHQKERKVFSEEAAAL